MSWRIGISTGVCTHLPILDILPAIAAAGAAGVEIGTPPGHFDPWHAAHVESLRHGLVANHLEAVSIHAPFGGPLDLADPNPHHRYAAIGASLTAAAAIKRLGGRLVIAHPSDLRRDQHDVPARVADAARSLTLLADACAERGLTLLVESPLPHLIGGHPDEFRRILELLPPSVGVCLDTGHTALGRHWHHFIDIAGHRLRHVHASDNFGERDDHLPPGRGHLDWRDIARTLRSVDFDGWIVLELACPGREPLAPYLANAFAEATTLLRP